MDYNPILKSIAKNIREIREKREMTQEAVAGLELNVRVYHKIESGQGTPSLKSLLIIADSLGVHPKELLDVPLLKDRPLKRDFPKRKRQLSKAVKKSVITPVKAKSNSKKT